MNVEVNTQYLIKLRNSSKLRRGLSVVGKLIILSKVSSMYEARTCVLSVKAKITFLIADS